MKPDEIRKPKYWSFPTPKGNYSLDSYNDATNTRVAQQKFYDEYYPSGQ